VPQLSEAEANAARKAFWTEAINAWTAAARETRNALSMTRHELAKLDSLGRLIMQRQALIENLGRYCRERPQADVAPALLALIIFLSDNPEGCCTLSLRRMSEMFAREERRIREALRRLAEAGVVHSEERPGTTARYWPVVHKDFGDFKAMPIWFVDAHSPASAPRGRPGKPRTEPSSQFAKTPDGVDKNPSPEPSPNTTNDATEEKRVGARVSFDGLTVQLHGDLRATWLAKFDDDAERLELALIAAVPYLQPNSNRPLEAQVSAQLARSVADKRDRDKRAAARAAVPKRENGRLAAAREAIALITGEAQ